MWTYLYCCLINVKLIGVGDFFSRTHCCGSTCNSANVKMEICFKGIVQGTWDKRNKLNNMANVFTFIWVSYYILKSFISGFRFFMLALFKHGTYVQYLFVVSSSNLKCVCILLFQNDCCTFLCYTPESPTYNSISFCTIDSFRHFICLSLKNIIMTQAWTPM